MKNTFQILTACIALLVFAGSVRAQTQGSEEDIQIFKIDFQNQVLELKNMGSVSWPLDGWRFCTHDEVDGFDYTSPTGLNGITMNPGDSLLVHWNNDATMYNAVNISALGGVSIDDLLTFTPGSAVSIGLYRDGGFGSSASLVDHVQYSWEAVNIASATPRGSVAVGAELWTTAVDWISIDSILTHSIELIDDPFPGAGNAHGPTSYEVSVPLTCDVFPTAATINTGVLAAGTVMELGVSDNVDYSVTRNPNGLQPIVQFTLDGNSMNPTPSEIDFIYEGSVFARAGVTQEISLFNYDTGSFEVVDTRAAMRFNDSTTTINIQTNPERFVEPGTGNMEARLRFQGSTARLQYAVNADMAMWTIAN